MKNNLFIISGPSASGKDTIIKELKKQGVKFQRVITTSTRPMRQGEKQGSPYWFISKEDFEDLIKEDKFVEWALVYGNYYGTQKKDLDRCLKTGQLVILKVDPQGARSIKRKFPSAKIIFIIPPDLETLEKRLKLRGKDSPESIKRRLEKAKEELKNLNQWDYLVLNEQGKLDKAVEEVKRILKGA